MSLVIWVLIFGEYELLIESDCESDCIWVWVELLILVVILGLGIYVEEGELVFILFEVMGVGEVISYVWIWLFMDEMVICFNCNEYCFVFCEEGFVELKIVDVYGCEVFVFIFVFLSEFVVYVLNVFSFNGDGLNDCFYV